MTARVLALLPLVLAAWWDGKYRIIPDRCVVLVLLCGLTQVWEGVPLLWAAMGLGVLGLPLLLLSLGGGIGGGDVKLCAALGFLLGAAAGCLTVCVALALMLIYGKVRGWQTAPFAPFLLLGYGLILSVSWS